MKKIPSIKAQSSNKLIIKGAREHNLKNIDIELPRDKLIVISGLSGSGKSSLAFDTIFAEGQRRYVESLSAYARQFLGRMDKPDIDYIEGLSPAISIEQKTTHKNPRSTVGTVTEIYDYYRLLYARIGHPHCPQCGKEIREQSVDQIIGTIVAWPAGTKIQILSPVIRGKKGEHQKVIQDAKNAGFVRARIDGMLVNLEDEIKLDKQKKHTIEVVVDRIVLSADARKRLSESVETALTSSGGTILVTKQSKGETESEVFFSQKNACPDCGISIPELQPRLFSFNNPFGACPECTGLGARQEFDPDLIIPDSQLSFDEGGIVPYNPDAAWNRSRFEALAKKYKFSLSTPLNELPEKTLSIILNGSGDDAIDFVYQNREGTGHFKYHQSWPGILSDMKRRYNETFSDSQKENYEKYMSNRECEVCKGKRLNPEALAVRVGEKIFLSCRVCP